MGIVFSKAYWIEKIYSYTSIFERELSYKLRFLNLISTYSNCFERSLLIGHITGSAFIVDESRRNVLLMHHTKLDKWLQPGGHCDGNTNVLAVAKKEVLEETGIRIETSEADIFDIDIHAIPERKGIPPHEHYDIRFLFEVPDGTAFIQNEESLALKWVPIDKITDFTMEESILRMVEKINVI
jgi:8-oxo-dGTP pyrophosphatase MutT (NUDIX family)